MFRLLKILHLALLRYDAQPLLTWRQAWRGARHFYDAGECAYLKACERNEYF